MFYIGSNAYSRSEVVAMEWLVQEVLKFQCYLPSMYNFLWYIVSSFVLCQIYNWKNWYIAASRSSRLELEKGTYIFLWWLMASVHLRQVLSESCKSKWKGGEDCEVPGRASIARPRTTLLLALHCGGWASHSCLCSRKSRSILFRCHRGKSMWISFVSSS